MAGCVALCYRPCLRHAGIARTSHDTIWGRPIDGGGAYEDELTGQPENNPPHDYERLATQFTELRDIYMSTAKRKDEITTDDEAPKQKLRVGSEECAGEPVLKAETCNEDGGTCGG